ncbi:MAG TPA: class I SAM-dependent rRNA methyltransferase [Elusimicrobiota bacterium]|nr:class I SAM-dependent rRNA methyltransferase [Elusimicrobiota bacterium]
MPNLAEEKRFKVSLKPGEERRLAAGHLWVFSNEIANIEAGAAAGDLAEIAAASGRLLGTAFYNPSSLIACRMISRQSVLADGDFFRRRLRRAFSERERRVGESAYRLCFGESDGLPGLVIDRYGDHLVLEVLSAGIERRLDDVAAALMELSPWKSLRLKNDHRMRKLEGLPLESRDLVGQTPERATISERDLKFHVPLAGGQKTGFYFDQRDNRDFLRPFYKDRTVLDCHCYLGAFALGAAKSGARAVLGIDSSAQAVELARENAALNGAGDSVGFEQGDAEEALESFARGEQPLKPDMILLDPPSFAPSRKDAAKALRHYVKLNALALQSLPPGGLLASSTCSHHVDREAFVAMLRSAQAKAGRPTRLLHLGTQAADHPILLAMPETEYLHFALLETLPA